MSHMRLKLLVAGVVLLTAAGYLALAGLRDGWVYHLQVHEFFQRDDVQNQRVRICGKVCTDGFDANPAQMVARFAIQDTEIAGGKTLPVIYRGSIPDRFKTDVEVIVEGRVDATGVFQADTLLTKCASKYQAEEHARRNKGA